MEEVKLVFMAGNYCFLWILCVWNGGYGDGAAELAGDVITELLFTVQFQRINECKSPLIGVLLAQQVVRLQRSRAERWGGTIKGKDSRRRRTPSARFGRRGLTAVRLLRVPFLFCLPFVRNSITGYRAATPSPPPRLPFRLCVSVRPSDCETAISRDSE